MKLGTENRKQTIAAAALGAVLLLVVALEFWPSSSTNASTATPAAADLPAGSSKNSHAAAHGQSKPTPGKKERIPQDLDPTLHLDQLALTEQIKYEGSGRNIFVAQAEEIPKPLAPGQTDPKQAKKDDSIYQHPPVPPPPPIPLKFFGFASQPGEPKKAFLSKGDDFFIAGEGEIIDRRYKVVKISNAAVDVQDVVNSGPSQSIPLTQGGKP